LQRFESEYCLLEKDRPMKKLNITLLTIALTLIAGFVFAQTSQNRHVADFDAVSSSGPFSVKVTINGTESVKVEADDDIINEIETVVEDNTLRIRWKQPHDREHHNIHKAEIYVSAKKLSGIINNGSGNINVEGSVDAEQVNTVLNGSGSISASVKSGKLQAAIHGSGSIKLNGQATDVNIAVSGSGQFDAKQLKTQHAAINISGSGNVYLNAEKELSGTIAGSGNVIYTGNAAVASTTIGSGRVRRAE
jgi:hypothetical protein